jgi:hypothetical protein
LVKQIGISIFLLITFQYLYGQEFGNLRRKELVLLTDTIILDTLSIIPGTIKLYYPSGEPVANSSFTANYAKASIVLAKEITAKENRLTVEYRVFPLLLEMVYSKRDYDKNLSPDSLLGRENNYYDNYRNFDPLFGEEIHTSGSIMRGLRFGNNQDITVSSSMNLQFKGELESGLMIEGAISDQTIPLQPEGTTARLEEFDRIYFKVYRNNFSVQAGNIELKSFGKNPFLSVRRSVQGVAYSGFFGSSETKPDTMIVTSAFAVPQGKYSRNTIVGSEGNQGPYRLSGANGEPYIMIIAGSERVFVDGVLLQRGEDHHYTMEYNLAELTFTQKTPINRSSRIIVEFQYSERSYARFNTFADVYHSKGKWKWRVSAFSEQDSKNQPFDQELNETQKRLLSNIGDNLELALSPQADSVSFDPEKILYEKIDTLAGSNTYTIYRHSTDPRNAHYRVFFTFVGQGKGNYTPDFGTANGRVYRWLSPKNGMPQGTYEPHKLLVAPQKKQMVASEISRSWGKGSSVSANYALSNTDLNTFSPFDSEDNIGHALRFSCIQKIFMADTSSAWSIGSNLLKTSSGFRIIDRTRTAEFERDWNIVQPLNGGDEMLIALWVDYIQPKKVYSKVMVEGLNIGQWYNGQRIFLTGWQKGRFLSTSWDGAYTNSQDTATKNQFYKGKIGIKKPIKYISIGLWGEFERSNVFMHNSDSLLASSFEWYQVKTSLSTPDTLTKHASIAYTLREDFRPVNGKIVEVGRSQDLMFDGKIENEKYGNASLAIGYRLFDPNDFVFTNIGKKEKTVLSRVEYSNKLLKGAIVFSGGYELGSGLEPEYEYYFVEVPAGQGVYTWIDYNGNGIKDLDEFEVASFGDEARFIRINIPGPNMLRVRNNALSIRSNLLPYNLMKNKGKIAAFVGRFSNQNSYIVKQKNQFDTFWLSANPFIMDEMDTLVTSLSRQFRNSFAFNRSNRRFGAEYIFNQSFSKVLLANGFEIRDNSAHRFVLWIGLGKKILLRSDGERFENSVKSQLFAFRNYNTCGNSSTTSIKYFGKNQATAEGGFKWQQSENIIGDESMISRTIFTQTDLAFMGKASILAKFSVVSNLYKGKLDSPAAYDMLKGLLPGRNAIWEISMRRRLTKVFELEVGYNGRYLSDGRVIHSGNMQARALF